MIELLDLAFDLEFQTYRDNGFYPSLCKVDQPLDNP